MQWLYRCPTPSTPHAPLPRSACTRELNEAQLSSALAERLPVDSPRVATLPYPIYHIYHFWLSTSRRALAASLHLSHSHSHSYSRSRSSPTERAVEPLLLLLHLLQRCATSLPLVHARRANVMRDSQIYFIFMIVSITSDHARLPYFAYTTRGRGSLAKTKKKHS